jgi:hypothetical protein
MITGVRRYRHEARLGLRARPAFGPAALSVGQFADPDRDAPVALTRSMKGAAELFTKLGD